MDNARNIIHSGNGAEGVDVGACTKAVAMLDAALGTVSDAGLQGDSPIVTAAQGLRERLQVWMQGRFYSASSYL